MKISELKPLERNPFKSKGDEQIKKIADSISSFEKMMRIRKIVIDENNQILGGNKRFFACKRLGMKEIPDDWIDKQTDLTEDEKREFIVKDNSHWGSEWDYEMLQDWDVNLEDWGVDLPDFEEEAEELEAVEDDYEIPDEIKTDIVLGDLFEIGEHRLLCGDSTDSDQVARLMNGENAELLFTSPPYNAGSLDIKGQKGTQKKYQSFDDNKTEDEYFEFIVSNINAFIPFVKEIFYNVGLVEGNKKALNKILFHFNDIFKDIIYWNKDTVAPHIQGGVINNKVEFIWCFGNGKRKFENAQFKQGSYWNVIEGRNASGNEFANVHKATFPVYLPDNIISNFSNKKSIVVDCFMGSGTTMVAAHQLKRKCYGIEIDSKYCQVIIDRMKKLDPDLVIKKNGTELLN